MSELWPTQDQIGLMVFPPVTTASSANDADCSVKHPHCACNTIYGTTGPTYLTSGSTYQILGLSTTYKTSNTATTLNLGGGSPVVQAVCQSGMTTSAVTCGSCAGIEVHGTTFFAGAIAAAQSCGSPRPTLSIDRR